MSRLLHLMLLLSLARPATPLAAVPSAGSISVCTNKACRKSGSLDTLRLLRSLASTVPTPVAASQIDSCGCLGNCGMGPNVYGEKTAEVFRDVYKPKSARALLEEELGLDLPIFFAGERKGVVRKRGQPPFDAFKSRFFVLENAAVRYCISLYLYGYI